MRPKTRNPGNWRVCQIWELWENRTSQPLYFFRKMILAETRYKTHNAELLAIVEAFKTCCHYLEDCKYKVLVLTNYNNLWQFMDTKSSSSCQVRWAQELSRHYFQINYWKSKANIAADALSGFLRRSVNEEEKLWAKNTQIFHCLQTSFTKASLSGLSCKPDFSLLHQVLICSTYVLLQLCQFSTTFRTELANKEFYKASIGKMRLRLAKFQKSNKKARRLRATAELKEGLENVNRVLYYQGLSFVHQDQTKPEVKGKVLWTIPILLFGRETSLHVKAF